MQLQLPVKHVFGSTMMADQIDFPNFHNMSSNRAATCSQNGSLSPCNSSFHALPLHKAFAKSTTIMASSFGNFLTGSFLFYSLAFSLLLSLHL